MELKRIKVSNIIVGLLVIGLSVTIALLITMPQLWTQIMMVKWEVAKGILIGLSALPVFLFVTIKGGTNWSKKWWVWASIGIVVVALLAIIVFQSSKGGNTNAMDMGIPQDMGMEQNIGVKGEMMIP